jgi:Uma2 family endonuclease
MLTSMLQPTPEFLDDRRRQGNDARDEVWDGELHVVPPALPMHQRFGKKLLAFLDRIAAARGFELAYETGLYDSERNYRVPDLLAYDTKHESQRGVEGPAVLAIEILSPDDESRAKLPFYANVGVGEVWLVDREQRMVEVYVLRDDRYFAVAPVGGVTHAPALEIALETSVIDGPQLRVAAGDVSTTI